jgi:hypothetical protein
MCSRSPARSDCRSASSFTASKFHGEYAVGLIGDGISLAVSVVGVFTADGASAISSGTFDTNDSKSITNNFTATPVGGFTCCSVNGRGTLTLQVSPRLMVALGFYAIDGSDVFLVNSDEKAIAGEAVKIPSGTSFSQSSLDGLSVIQDSGISPMSLAADIAVANANGAGAVTINHNVSSGGRLTSSSSSSSYSVSPNGRVTLGGGDALVLYLFGQPGFR